MPAYSDRSNPPAPLVLATVRNPNANKSITDVPMLLDTGADMSIVPRLVGEAVGVVPAVAEEIRLVAFDGTAQSTEWADVQILFLDKTFRGRFTAANITQSIIGRDILNLLSLHLDGPRLVWDVLPTR